jgi:hypothetical protein
MSGRCARVFGFRHTCRPEAISGARPRSSYDVGHQTRRWPGAAARLVGASSHLTNLLLDGFGQSQRVRPQRLPQRRRTRAAYSGRRMPSSHMTAATAVLRPSGCDTSTVRPHRVRVLPTRALHLLRLGAAGPTWAATTERKSPRPLSLLGVPPYADVEAERTALEAVRGELLDAREPGASPSPWASLDHLAELLCGRRATNGPPRQSSHFSPRP